MAHTTQHRKVFFYSVLIIVLLLSAIVVFPFFKAIIAALVAAFVFYPLFTYIQTKINNRTISALLVVIIVLLLITVPFLFLLNQVIKESTVTFITLQQVVFQTESIKCPQNNMVCGAVDYIQSILKNPQVKFYLADSLQKVSASITQSASAFVVSIPKTIVNIALFFITFFYFLRDGKKIIQKTSEIMPLKESARERIFTQFHTLSNAIVFGYVISALFQGIVALLGFWFANWMFSNPGDTLISAPILWASVIALTAMIPILGSWMVFVPMSFFILMRGFLAENMLLVYGGIFLLLYGSIVIAQIDNIVRPILSGSRAKVHSLIIFLGVFGGMFTFGIIGIVLGPLILALLITILKIYQEGDL